MARQDEVVVAQQGTRLECVQEVMRKKGSELVTCRTCGVRVYGEWEDHVMGVKVAWLASKFKVTRRV